MTAMGRKQVLANDRYRRWAQWVDATPWLVSNSLIWWHQDPRFASAVDRHSRLHCRKVALRKVLNNKILPAGEQVLRRPVEAAVGSGHSMTRSPCRNKVSRRRAERPLGYLSVCPNRSPFVGHTRHGPWRTYGRTVPRDHDGEEPRSHAPCPSPARARACLLR